MSQACNSTRCFRFENSFGERWEVVIDPETRTGILRGDETGWEPVSIRDDRIEANLGLAGEEYRCLADVWRRTTGGELQPNWINHLESLLAEIAEGD
jgi:hypothetical protein